MSGDTYARIAAILVFRKENAFLIDLDFGGDDDDRKHWIPYSLVHAADEAAIKSAGLTDKITFRLRAWKIREIGAD